MISVRNKRYKITSLFLIVALIVPTFAYIADPYNWRVNARDTNNHEQEIHRMAADISNMTGVETERILKLQAAGLSWNEILEALKDGDIDQQQAAGEKRNLLLMESSLGKYAMNRLISEGFNEQDIQGAKLIAERVAFHLKEFVQDSQVVVPNPKETKSVIQETQRLEAFRSVAEQFDLETAIRWMVLLHAELKSFEAALDEYLSSLQFGLLLEDYLNDREEYLKLKEQKKLEMVGQLVVTAYEIEREMLERIQTANETDFIESSIPTTGDIERVPNDPDIPIPDVPTAKTLEIKPSNPTESIMLELENLNPNISLPFK